MGFVMEMQGYVGWRRWYHKLFQCAGFWKFWRDKPFHCPICGKGYTCYWDGNDTNGMINLCDKCVTSVKEKYMSKLDPTIEELLDLKKSFKDEKDYKGYMIKQVINARIESLGVKSTPDTPKQKES